MKMTTPTILIIIIIVFTFAIVFTNIITYNINEV